ncbi:hypothetical protein E3N88_07169 [Mikania micrantha]|uniref:DUF7963 domain-containing protein n=1 Tax=Mikania micrantha TaxID=192012 RepID=A0A5N6PQS1_9ASTR|nr:hypothetical protein E3N88_07169 [Mikania micrantha]
MPRSCLHLQFKRTSKRLCIEILKQAVNLGEGPIMAVVTNSATTKQSPSPADNTVPSSELTTDEMAVKAVHKRYEGLVMVRTKAIKGKGAWYWAHLEPNLVCNPGTGVPESVKLRWSLCEALSSTSNPSRKASEHLKRGTCPNYNSDWSPKPNPISSVSPAGMVDLSSPTSSSHLNR